MTVADGEFAAEVGALLVPATELIASGDGEFSCVIASRLSTVIPISGAGDFSCELSVTLAGTVPALEAGSFRGAGPSCSYTGWGGC